LSAHRSEFSVVRRVVLIVRREYTRETSVAAECTVAKVANRHISRYYMFVRGALRACNKRREYVAR